MCSVAKSYPTVCDPMDCHIPLFMEFSRQEYWNKLLFPPPGNLPNPGIKLMSPTSLALAGRFLTTEPLGKPFFYKEGNEICHLNLPTYSIFSDSIF